MNTTEFKDQAAQALNGIIAKGILRDTIRSRRDNEYQMIAYAISMGLNKPADSPVKFGLIFAVIDLLDAIKKDTIR